jgi:RHS repeat-associated protein
MVVSPDNGKVLWKTDYKPFGEEDSITGTIENNEKFAGKEKDKETGLYYFGARYMGAKIGRFLTVDPVGIRESDLMNPQRLNRYAYALNNPYKYIDPDGRLTVHIWNYRGKNVAWGHASVTLENGTHISWWPSTEGRAGLLRFMNIYTADANDPQEFATDVKWEGQKPDYQIKIKGLDEKKIEKWWDELKKNNQWKTLSQNCSTTAADALKAGGAEDYSSWGSSHYIIWTPNDVKDFAYEINYNMILKEYRRKEP